jgi:hypothetical protein
VPPTVADCLTRDRAASDGHCDVPQTAVQAIAAGCQRGPGTLPLLRDRANTDTDMAERQTAAQAIGRTERRQQRRLVLAVT